MISEVWVVTIKLEICDDQSLLYGKLHKARLRFWYFSFTT